MSTYIDSRIINLTSSNAYSKSNGNYLSNVLFKCAGLLKQEKNIEQVHVKIMNAQIPVSFYIINDNNNKLNYSVSGGAVKTIILSNGNYNANSLITEMIKKFLLNADVFAITINSPTGILTFSISVGTFSFLFSGSTLLKVLGFLGTTDYNSTLLSLTAPYPCNLLGVKKLKIICDELPMYSYDSVTSGFSNILGVIAVNTSSFGLILYEKTSNQSFLLRGINIGLDINQLDIKILDEDNNFINFNNVDWAITLCLDITRTPEILSPQTFSDILNSQNTLLTTPAQKNQDTNTLIDTPDNDLDLFMYNNHI